MKMKYNGILALLSIWVVCSCSNEQAPPQEPKSFQTVTFTQTNAIVQKTEIELDPEKFVEVDFNGDGLMDLAVIEEPDALTSTEEPEGETLPEEEVVEEPASPRNFFNFFKKKGITIPRSQLTVYIQESDGKYYLGGKIIDVKSGEIIGLAYKKNTTDFYDLLLVYQYHDGETEVVRYENDGTGFTLLNLEDKEAVEE